MAAWMRVPGAGGVDAGPGAGGVDAAAGAGGATAVPGAGGADAGPGAGGEGNVAAGDTRARSPIRPRAPRPAAAAAFSWAPRSKISPGPG